MIGDTEIEVVLGIFIGKLVKYYLFYLCLSSSWIMFVYRDFSFRLCFLKSGSTDRMLVGNPLLEIGSLWNIVLVFWVLGVWMKFTFIWEGLWYGITYKVELGLGLGPLV